MNKHVLILRFFLVCAAFGWGISAFGIFAPWPMVKEQLAGLGAQDLPDNPMLIYWLRMTAGAFTAIGVLFLLTAIWPKRFRSLILPGGVFLLAESLILLTHGILLKLDPIPSYVDMAFCFFIGLGILLC